MKHLSLFSLLVCSAYVAQALDMSFFDTVAMPSDISIAVDESIYLKIINPIEGQTGCSYKAPGKKELNSADPFVSFSDDKCGIKIEKVQKYHEGVWKLMSVFKNSSHENSIKGTSVVHVMDRVTVEKKQNQIFASDENFLPSGYDFNYCYVSRRLGFSKLSEINSMKCTIPQNLDNDFAEGEWVVNLGLSGMSNEVTYSVNIQSTDEKIETTVKRIDNGNVQLLCHIKNLKNILKFCRFERVGDSDSFGLNLEDGIASGNYRYFGDGFANGDCGLEIKNMNGNDKAQWRCFVGLMDFEDAMNTKISDDKRKTYKHSAVVDASDDWNKIKILTEDSEIFFVDNTSAIIQCNANNPFDYCWFQHPVHRILWVSDRKESNDDDDFQYFGDGFLLGHCGIKIKRFHFSDAGEWKCGVGRVADSVKEAVKAIKVEVKASSMMAITKQIEDFSGNSIVLQCRAIPIGSSLASCHFLLPTEEAFSINEKITQANAIDGNFYFDPNRKLSDGYCTVVIKELRKDEHAGKWICSGRIFGQDDESYDSIYVTVDGLRGASFSYLSLAIVLPLVAVLVSSIFGYRIWKQIQQVRNDTLDDISMHTIGSNNTQTTTSSEDSRSSNFSVVHLTEGSRNPIS